MTRPTADDLRRLDDGRHLDLHQVLGAQPLGDGRSDAPGGVRFAVWAPAARAISVTGDWNGFDPGATPMHRHLDGDVWIAEAPSAQVGHRYRFAVIGADGATVEHADPLAMCCEPPPGNASIVHRSTYEWGDHEWMQRRAGSEPRTEPMSIYEVHLGSWRRDPTDPQRELGYRELAEPLAEHTAALGFTHVELLPVMAHPFAGSWGYQVTNYFAPTPRWGEPDDLKHLVDVLHQAGIGVLLDWVPAHFPRDPWALGRFDGTALYEHPDPRRGEHQDWGTFVFDYGRGGVRSFLLSNARWWLDEYHADGLRVDAVASMLYLDYSRAEGEWLPNEHGGREHLEAVSLLRELNVEIRDQVPGASCTAEESTAWAGVSNPTADGGLGFTFKWNLGWMHDTLAYFGRDPIHRRHHHDQLTFSMHYASSEEFVLPLSHDEVVHLKGSLLAKMPGDEPQQLASLRALYGWMWAHPGKQLLFMGGELAQHREWDHDSSLPWDLLDQAGHAGVQRLVADLNTAYRAQPALWERDREPDGFAWLCNDPERNLSAFVRRDARGDRVLACIANLSAVACEDQRIGLPVPGPWRAALDTDAERYGGSGTRTIDEPIADGDPLHGQPWSASLHLAPLSVVWLEPAPDASHRTSTVARRPTRR